MKRTGFVLIGFMAVLFAAQKPQVNTNVSPEQVFVGDRITVTWTVTAPADYALLFPQITEEALALPVLETSFQKKITRQTRNETLQCVTTSFDTGFVRIPPLPVVYGDSTGFGRHDTVLTPVKYVYVRSVLDSVQQAIPQAAPLPLSPMLWWEYIILAALTGGAAFFLIRGLKMHPRHGAQAEKSRWQTPEERAAAALDELERSAFLKKGEWKEFYLALTVILKKYYESKYFIHLRELSTTDVLPELEPVLQAEEFMTVKNKLMAWDLVKFARQAADKETCLKDLASVREITTQDTVLSEPDEGKEDA